MNIEDYNLRQSHLSQVIFRTVLVFAGIVIDIECIDDQLLYTCEIIYELGDFTRPNKLNEYSLFRL